MTKAFLRQMLNISEGPAVRSYEEIIPFNMPDWDTIVRGYETKCLFHETAWLRFLERSQGAQPSALRLLGDGGRVVGYFCAAEVRKGFFRLLGSPLQGWTTNLMGPVVNEVDRGSFLHAVEDYCRKRKVDYIEMSHPALPPSVMAAAGYELDADATFIVPIDDETVMWDRLHSKSCRYAIRRAMRNGLRVERATDPAFVEQYYAQLQDVFLRQGLVPTYNKARVQALWDVLMPAGRLLALRVCHGDEVIATGLFPYDERAIYFWGGASWVRAYPLAPNELLQWHVLLYAREKGIPIYNMGGGGRFKEKFGGERVIVHRWFKSLSPAARIGRTAFKHYVRVRQRALGGLKRLFSERPAAEVTEQ